MWRVLALWGREDTAAVQLWVHRARAVQVGATTQSPNCPFTLQPLSALLHLQEGIKADKKFALAYFMDLTPSDWGTEREGTLPRAV